MVQQVQAVRVLIAQATSDSAGIHPLERIHAGTGFVVENVIQNSLGFFAPQCADQHPTNIIFAIQHQRTLFVNFLIEGMNDLANLITINPGQVGHGDADLVEFARIQVAENFGGMILAQRHQHHGGPFDALEGRCGCGEFRHNLGLAGEPALDDMNRPFRVFGHQRASQIHALIQLLSRTGQGFETIVFQRATERNPILQ